MSEAGVMNTEEWNGEWDGDANSLWAAGLEEAPPPGSDAALLSALGLGGTPPGPGGGIPAASAPSSGGAFVRPEATGWLRPWMKGSAIGLVIVGLPVAWFALPGDDEDASSSRALDVPASAPVIVKTETVATNVAQNDATPEPDAAPANEPSVKSVKAAAPPTTVSAPAVAKTEPTTTEPTTAAREPSLAEELAFVQGAKALVASRRWAEAEARLDAYRRDFPKQRLAAEARVVRVEMLVAQGKKAEARQVAGPVLEPGSPYRERVLSLVGGE